MKYSACLYEKGGETLAQAEIAMLKTYVERAELKDGQRILDLGYASLHLPKVHT
jgi:cyclopropane fatty-acyl-phospholipid synthase-like methyltransferase